MWQFLPNGTEGAEAWAFSMIAATPPLIGPEEAQICWYAVRVRSNFEQICAAGIQNRGFETFLPSYQVRRKWSDRVKTIQRPLFPGYLFCRFDASIRSEIAQSPGVVHIVGSGREILPVDQVELNYIRTVVMARVAASPYPFLKSGQRILIQNGPLAGIEGVLESIKGIDTLIVSITLLQRSVAVEVAAEWICGL